MSAGAVIIARHATARYALATRATIVRVIVSVRLVNRHALVTAVMLAFMVAHCLGSGNEQNETSGSSLPRLRQNSRTPALKALWRIRWHSSRVKSERLALAHASPCLWCSACRSSIRLHRLQRGSDVLRCVACLPQPHSLSGFIVRPFSWNDYRVRLRPPPLRVR